MKNKQDKYIYLSGESLVYGTSYNVTIVAIIKERCIIKGIVNDTNGKPINEAVVEVKEVNPYTKKSTSLGYTFANDKGEYVISIIPSIEMMYEVTAYSSLE